MCKFRRLKTPLQNSPILQRSARSRESSNYSRAHFSAGGNVREGDKHKPDEAGDCFGHVHENTKKHCECEPKYGPMCSVLEVGKRLQCMRTHQRDRKRAHKYRSDAKAGNNDGERRGDGERPNDAVERECGVEHIEIHKER